MESLQRPLWWVRQGGEEKWERRGKAKAKVKRFHLPKQRWSQDFLLTYAPHPLHSHTHTHTHTHTAMLDEIVLGVCFDVYTSLLSTAFIFKSRYLDIFKNR